ncbi:hypothetical protein OB955_11760 [Halobacteria archaeon AArc-m2/3/4]|uniref:Uncharacterized protein n=1 Tax=Natronoglomus mannanivorans TaxID=2979990 RepID=A0AAP3E1W5_9EURY|nr:hypothetical protein [Halobacteria archaeon AArc-xg1-1]MCU4973416.1 hypothetical protein [Halobacteria archaeon AArc-m2/3/4]
MSSGDLSKEELERTAGQTWFVGGIFLGLGAAPVVGLVVYAIARLFFTHSLAALLVLTGALLSFALGLTYVALARTLEDE